MNRNDFGTWGLELNDDDFARAIAALGISIDLATTSISAVFDAGTEIKANRSVSWYLDKVRAVRTNSLPDLNAANLATTWAMLTAEHGEKFDIPEYEHRPNRKLLRLQISPPANANYTDLRWAVETLARRAVGASSVYISNPDETNIVVWDYPLRIGLLGDERSKELRADIENLEFNGQPLTGTHITIVDLTSGNSDCDILMVPHDLKSAAVALIEGPSALRADLVIVTGAIDEADSRTGPLFESIRTQARASGVCLFPIAPAEIENYHLDTRQVWFKELVRELSHDCTIDVALFRASRHQALAAAAPIIYASEKLIEASRITRRIEQFREQVVLPTLSGGTPREELQQIADHLAEWVGDRDVIRMILYDAGLDVRDFILYKTIRETWSEVLLEADRQNKVSDLLQASVNLLSSPELEQRYKTFLRREQERKMIEEMELSNQMMVQDQLNKFDNVFRSGDIEELAWAHEGDTATDFSEAKSAILESVEALPQPPKKVRWIQTEIWEHPENGEKRNVSWGPGFRWNRAFSIEVFIGKKSALAVAADVAFDDSKLPPGKNEHELTVIFTEPNISPEPKISTITLPREGDSTRCEFFIKVPDKIERMQARIIIAYKNRILQTALLTAPIFEGPPGAEDDGKIELIVESAARPGLADLTERIEFDTAFLLNHTHEGDAQVTMVRGKRAELVSLADLEQTLKWFDDRITEVAVNWDEFGKLEDDASQDLLRECARRGSALYRGLTRGRQPENVEFLRKAERIQITTVKAGSRLPLEFAYDRRAPKETAPLCANAKKALKDGKCSTCLQTGPAEAEVICPLGFWGLNRVIERHVYDPAVLGQTGADFALQAEPVGGRTRLKVFDNALAAFSDNVDAEDDTSSGRVLAALKNATKKDAKKAAEWDEWVTDVTANSPSLLVLLPHTIKDADSTMWMEIGADERLSAVDMHPEFVLGPAQAPTPIVLLLGCETTAPDIAYEDFVMEFRELGAALVVGTGSKILGRHASTVAAAFIEGMVKAQDTAAGKPFGDIMLKTRRQMIADGLLMAFCLSSYGDTDWLI